MTTPGAAVNIQIEQYGRAYRVKIDGPLDTAGSAAIENEFSTHCKSKPNVIVDLSKVPYIASIGIRLLVAGAKAQAKIGGKMVLMKPDELLQRILKTTGIEQLMPVVATLQEADDAFSAS